MKVRAFACFVVLLFAVTAIWSQDTRGTIVGRVTDATGAVVPNAEVQVTNKAMGTNTSLKTNQEGLYTAPLLLPGQYSVTVTSQGFKKFLRDNIELRIADRIEINAALELGTSEQTITVAEAAPLMSTETASMGNVITSQQIMDLPLSYGNPFALIGISAGTGFVGSPRLDRPFEPTHIANFTMNGTRGDRSDITLDGAPATATADGGQVIATYVPPTDILSEFKVQTAIFDAAAGNTEGGVTNLSIKSGTNTLHGTGYYTNTRKGFWANDFVNNRLGKERPDFHFDRWGFSLGGPVTIPKLYKGENKTFFLFGYEGIKDSRPRYDASTPQVPTAEMKNGDFSQVLKAGGTSYQVYDPYTRRLDGTAYREDPFPGNIVPAARFDKVGKAILDKYYPAATSTGDAYGANNLLIPSLAETADYYNLTGRVDQNVSDKQRIYARYSMYRRTSWYNDYFGTPATGIQFIFDSYNTVFDDTYILTPTMVLDVRYGYNRFIRGSDGNPAATGFDVTALGLPSSYAAQISKTIARFPRIDLSGYIGTGFTGEYRPVDTHSFSASLTKTLSSHSLHGGVDWRAYRENDGFFSNDQTGRFTFDASYTKGPLSTATAPSTPFGLSAAALLMGIPTSGSGSYVARTADYAEQSMTYGFYLQDDWKITPKLTLNLGLRYEFETPLKERYNRTVQTFDPNATQPFADAAGLNYAASPAVPGTGIRLKGGLTFNNGNALYNTPKTGFLPRFGFAYQLPKDTVVRGGFGFYQGFLGERRGDVIQPGFSRSTSFNPFASDNTTIVNPLSNPLSSSILDPVGSAQGAQTFVGQNISFFNQDPKMPLNYRWQLSLQRQLPGSVLVEAAYVGNKGIRIELTRNINGLPNQYLSAQPTRDNTTNSYLSAAVANPFYKVTMPTGTPSSFTSSTIGRQQLLLPYPQFTAINTTSNEGYSWYHGLQLRAEKRFHAGLTMNANYTWSKFMGATDLLNAQDPGPTRMIYDQDTPHRIAISSIYQFPFGKGHKVLNTSNGALDRIVSGWEVTSLWSFQSGTPLAFGSYSNTATTNSNDFFLANGNVVLPVGQRTWDHWFNTGAFVTTTADQPVSHLRVNPYRYAAIRGPRPNNVDISLIKDTRINERMRARFSLQALNAFNHPLFAAPNTTSFTSASTFGQVTSSTQNNYPRRLQIEVKFIF